MAAPLRQVRMNKTQQQHAENTAELAISVQGENNSITSQAFWLTSSQTTASPFVAPFLLRVQIIMKVLAVPPASQNATATRWMLDNLESFNFLSQRGSVVEDTRSSPVQCSCHHRHHPSLYWAAVGETCNAGEKHTENNSPVDRVPGARAKIITALKPLNKIYHFSNQGSPGPSISPALSGPSARPRFSPQKDPNRVSPIRALGVSSEKSS